MFNLRFFFLYLTLKSICFNFLIVFVWVFGVFIGERFAPVWQLVYIFQSFIQSLCFNPMLVRPLLHLTFLFICLWLYKTNIFAPVFLNKPRSIYVRILTITFLVCIALCFYDKIEFWSLGKLYQIIASYLWIFFINLLTFLNYLFNKFGVVHEFHWPFKN